MKNKMPKIETKLKVVNEGEEKAKLYLYGPIRQAYWWDDEDDCISAKRVRDALGKLKGEDVDIHLNSNGGDVFESIAICNTIKQHDGEVNICIDAMAASGASIIATAGKNVFMPSNAMQMIHKAWTIAAGNADEMRKVAEDLDKIDSSVKASYMTRFVGTEEELESLLADETFLTAEECLTLGFCDEILEDSEPEPQANTKEGLLAKYQKHEPKVDNKQSAFFNAFNKSGGNK